MKFIFEHLGKHQPIYRKIDTIQSDNHGFIHIKEVQELYFKFIDIQLRVPLINFHLHGEPSIGAMKTGPNNELKENVYYGLIETDTLIAQQLWLILE